MVHGYRNLTFESKGHGYRARLNEIIYIATINISMSNEDIQKLDEEGNEYEVWGKHGVVEEVINMSNAQEFPKS